MLTAIVGVNWGDEGKGRMVDLFSADFDIVCRYQGGNNAGHTVINHLGKFILNLLPSGILREGVVNVMGNGMVIDLEHLNNEINRLTEKGVKISPQNLKISDKAIICLPYHVRQDVLEEERLKDKKYGSTKKGIAPVYGDKYLKKAARMGELKNPQALKDRMRDIIEWKNLIFEGVYKAEKIILKEIDDYIDKYSRIFSDFIADTSLYLDETIKAGKDVMFEAQLGALRDIDFGIYPYTSSSSTIAAYAPIGAGVPNHKIDKSIGIMKAYSTCVGEGPFVAEIFGEEADELRKAGGEYGATTGRPRRIGSFDIPASRYGARVQGADEIALTKLDVLSYMKEIPVCVAYELDGRITTEFPFAADLNRCRPVIKYYKGWQKDISDCKSRDELPKEANDYIDMIEKAVGYKISYISVGAERNQYIKCI
jgi:adenylosuccinate synthase